MRGYLLVDEVGTRVGRIEEAEDGWLTVRLGRFSGLRALVPADEAVAAGQYVWVPYRLERILKAARVAPEGPPEGPAAEVLERIYGTAGRRSRVGSG